MTIRQQPRQRKKIATWLSVLLAIIILLGMAEIALRKQHKTLRDRLAAKYAKKELTLRADKDPRLIYSYNPDRPGINSKGYRDHEYAYRKEQGVFRIITIGDSVAAGYGVGLEETFSKVLERRLNHNTKGKKFEVIILARDGYSTSQEMVLFEKEAFQYDPDAILWSYCLNDPAHPVFHNANGETGLYFYKPKVYLFHFISKKWFYFMEKIKGYGCDPEYHKFLHCAYWDEVVSNIEKIGKISKEKNVPVIFLIHPVFEPGKFYPVYAWAELHQKLAQAATEHGLIACDLYDAYKTACSFTDVKRQFEYWNDGWHPSPKGHRLISEYIYSLLHRALHDRLGETSR
jgi:lysophospholipase L1-like esterase